MNFDTFSNGYASVASSGNSAALALDTTAKDRLVILVSRPSTCGNMQVVSNLDSFNISEEGVEIPGKLYLQISNCDNVSEGLNMLLKMLQEHSDLVKNTTHLDISFVENNNKGDSACIGDAKSVAEELVKLLPYVTFYVCDLGIMLCDTMFAFTSAVADMYASQLTGLVCNWKALHMGVFLEKLSSLEYLSIRRSGGPNRLFEGRVVLPKLSHLSVYACPFTLSLLSKIAVPQCISKLAISIEDMLLLEMTDFVLDTISKRRLGKHCRNTTSVFDTVFLSNDLLSQDVKIKEATVFINKEVDPDDVARINWDNATKMVVNTYIGFADILMILHHSPRINDLEAEKVIERLYYERNYLFNLLDDTEAMYDHAIYDIAIHAVRYGEYLPAKLVAILDCSDIDEYTIYTLRRWGYWYNNYLEEMDASTIYHVYSDEVLPKHEQYELE